MLAGSVDTYRGGLPIVHSQMLFYGLVNFTSTLEHAGRCPTHHHMVFAHLTSVEHGVKGGNLIYPDWWHVQDLRHLPIDTGCWTVLQQHLLDMVGQCQMHMVGHLVHSTQAKPSFVLLLS